MTVPANWHSRQGPHNELIFWKDLTLQESFPGDSVGKHPPANAEDSGSIPGSGRSPGEGNGNPLRYSCLENPMDKGAWRATVHGVTKSRTRVIDWACMHEGTNNYASDLSQNAKSFSIITPFGDFFTSLSSFYGVAYCFFLSICLLLGYPKSSFEFFSNILWKLRTNFLSNPIFTQQLPFSQAPKSSITLIKKGKSTAKWVFLSWA